MSEICPKESVHRRTERVLNLSAYPRQPNQHEKEPGFRLVMYRFSVDEMIGSVVTIIHRKLVLLRDDLVRPTRRKNQPRDGKSGLCLSSDVVW